MTKEPKSELPELEAALRALRPDAPQNNIRLATLILLGSRDHSILGRLQRRYEERLDNIDLPKEGLATEKQAQAAARLSTTYSDLLKLQIALGLAPEPKDNKVREAERIRTAFERNERRKKAVTKPC